jgi:hypothetical protein
METSLNHSLSMVVAFDRNTLFFNSIRISVIIGPIETLE